MKTICVFCGASTGSVKQYDNAAAMLGRSIAERGWRLIYGGGNTGLMGTVATATLQAGGYVIGVIPHSLEDKELALKDCNELHVVKTMHERKAMMAERADAFIALPGGFGTLDELFEIITWAQLGFHRKPIVLVNINEFYAPLIAMVDHMIAAGFVKATHRRLVVVTESAEAALDLLETYDPPLLDRWIERKDI